MTYYNKESDFNNSDKKRYVDFINTFLEYDDKEYTDEQINKFLIEFRHYAMCKNETKKYDKNLELALWLFKDHIVDKFDFYTSEYVPERFKFGYKYMLEYFKLIEFDSTIKNKVKKRKIVLMLFEFSALPLMFLSYYFISDNSLPIVWKLLGAVMSGILVSFVIKQHMKKSKEII